MNINNILNTYKQVDNKEWFTAGTPQIGSGSVNTQMYLSEPDSSTKWPRRACWVIYGV